MKIDNNNRNIIITALRIGIVPEQSGSKAGIRLVFDKIDSHLIGNFVKNAITSKN